MIGCLRTRVRKQPINALYIGSETGLKFYNFEARFSLKLYSEIIIIKVDTILFHFEHSTAHKLILIGMYFKLLDIKVSKGTKIKNRYNQVTHLPQDTNGKATNSQPDTTNESQKVSPFPADDQKAHINRRTQRHSKQRQKKHKRSTKEYRLGTVSKTFYWRA